MIKVKRKNKKILQQRGITLVALVISIILLLILAGISIQAITNTGIFEQAENAKRASEIASIKEKISLDIYEKQLTPPLGSITEGELIEILGKYFDDVPETLPEDLSTLTLTTKSEYGNYSIKVSDVYTGGTAEDTRTLLADGSWDGTVNRPKLMEGMTGIYWDDSGNEVEVTAQNQDNWYDYNNQKWANAKTEDGSYWVWIPRYEYKITTPYTSTASTISVKFIPTTQTTVDSEYTYIHPAFENGSASGKNNNYKNGEWDAEIPGFWVAKYPAGFQANTITNNNGTLSATIQNSSDTVVYSNANYNDYNSSFTTNALSQTLSSKPKMSYPVFKPLTYAYNNISTGDSYTLAQEIKNGSSFYGLNSTKTETDSHMMKNSEWGAVAYLTQSSCGRSGTEVNLNNYYTTESSPWRTAITGICTDGTSGNKTTTLGKPYNDVTVGVKGSSTANITGVYDLNGCVWEETAGYISNGTGHLSEFGSAYASTSANTNGYLTLSTKYATVYPYNSSDSNANNYNTYKGLKSSTYGYGDAILETSTSGADSTSWNGDYTSFPLALAPFFKRGGNYKEGSGAGAYSFDSTYGEPHYFKGFRAVLIGV